MTKITPNECAFFHVVDLPGHGPTNGSWDFRKTEKEYLGNVDLAGKRVLELGTATGSHAFYMESVGAKVVAYDLSPDFEWDLLLDENEDEEKVRELMRNGIKRINNSFLFCREKLQSKVQPAYGSIYNIPKDLGDFDIVTFGSILLHVRDPIGALLSTLKRVKDKVIITDRMPPWDEEKPFMEFIPKMEFKKPWGGWTWWFISPTVYSQVLNLAGFSDIKISMSKHRFVPSDTDVELFTLVAKR